MVETARARTDRNAVKNCIAEKDAVGWDENATRAYKERNECEEGAAMLKGRVVS